MVRLATPVPEGTWIPQLANRPPGVFANARLYGWGTERGRALNRTSTVVYDPVAASNAAERRPRNPIFAAFFPDGITPMILDAVPARGETPSGPKDVTKI